MFRQSYGTFATAGSDGAFSFWDKDSKQRLKVTPQQCAFHKGSLFLIPVISIPVISLVVHDFFQRFPDVNGHINVDF